MSELACPVCRRPTFDEILRLDGLPVEEGRLATTPMEAVSAATAKVQLHRCSTCSLVYDVAPRPETVRYDDGYSTFMGHSPSFARHVQDTATGLVARHRLSGGLVVDIACGFGDFLVALLDSGMARGLGVDPAATASPDPRIDIVREYFTPALLPPDIALVSCRHMLYLLDDPVRFLTGLREALGDNEPLLYLELMDQRSALSASDPWDVTVEHRSYFTAESAARLLEVCGFEPLDIRPCHHDRFLAVEARPLRRPTPGSGQGLDRVAGPGDVAAGLQTRIDERIVQWRAALATVRGNGGRIVAWCAGARAISFLSLTGAGPEIAGVVDVSPCRQGRYMPVSARPVVAPAQVRDLDPDAVLVTNTAYTAEIRDALDGMGLGDVPLVELDDPTASETLIHVARR